MSRSIVPRLASAELGMNKSSTTQKPRKISTACGACKQRKTKCSGNAPCDACSTRGSACIYDVTSDQRRKVANQKNIQDLSEAQTNLDRHQQLLGGIIAIMRVGSIETTEDLVGTIRSGVDLSQIAAHVRNARRTNPAIESSFADIEFVIDGPEELPSPTQLLTNMPSQSSIGFMGPPFGADGIKLPSIGSLPSPDQKASFHG